MLLLYELPMLLSLMVVKESSQQSTNPSSTKYQRISVESNSFQDIRFTNLANLGCVSAMWLNLDNIWVHLYSNVISPHKVQ